MVDGGAVSHHVFGETLIAGTDRRQLFEPGRRWAEMRDRHAARYEDDIKSAIAEGVGNSHGADIVADAKKVLAEQEDAGLHGRAVSLMFSWSILGSPAAVKTKAWMRSQRILSGGGRIMSQPRARA